MSKLTPEFLASTHERIKNYDFFPHREVIVLLDEIDRLNAKAAAKSKLLEALKQVVLEEAGFVSCPSQFGLKDNHQKCKHKCRPCWQAAMEEAEKEDE